MKSSLFSPKKIVLIALAAIILAGLSLWLALPGIVKSQAEKFVAERTGHQLVMERPKLDLWELALHLGKLQLRDPAGEPLLSFDSLLVDLSGASLTRRAWVFDAIRIDGLAATLVELPAGKLNWTPFLEALKSKEEKPEPKTGLPRLDIKNFTLSRGALDYADRRRTAEGFATRIEPLEIELTDLSTLPNEEGKFKLSARTALGAQIDLSGQLDLDPLRSRGHFSLTELQLAKLAPYVKNALPVPPEGVLSLSADFRAGNDGGRFDAAIDQLQARLTGLRVALKDANGPVASVEAIELKDGRFELGPQVLALAGVTLTGGRLSLPGVEPAPQFGALGVENIQVALAERSATVGHVRLTGGRVQAQRRGDGSIDLVEALKTLTSGASAAEKPTSESREAAAPWRYRIEKVDVADLGVVLQDASVKPALELALDEIALQTEGVTHDLNAALPLKLSCSVRSGGRLEAAGKLTPATASAEVEVKLADLALKPAQPYLADKTTLTLADGKLSVHGRVRYDERGPEVRAEFAVRDLSLLEPGERKPLLAWKSLDSRKLVLTQKMLDLGELRLVGLDTRLLIDKDKNINFKRVLKPSAASAAPTTPATPVTPAPAAQSEKAKGEAFLVNIDRLRFEKGSLDFADESLILPFGTRIHDLKGSIAGLSTRPGALGQVELDGQVDDYGMARAAGQVELGNPTNGLDLRVQFRNVEMTRLTPYTATFVGRKIDSGKLSLDLQYKIVKRQLTGDNQVIMDKLVLGERIESPTAKDLPLDLALALLKDGDGRIDLGLPVSGSLDDPQFSYGALIWKAITNVLTKIVTAPFRALGALLGGGGESLESIVFEAGMAQLTPPEREKVDKLAAALAKRPSLVLAIGGQYAESDRLALQDRQLRRAVLVKAGQSVPDSGDPGPVSTQAVKIQEALEALYAERVGKAELAALKEGFRQANPGQLEQNLAGKVMTRLTGLLREKKTLSEREVAQLKGADFYGVLFDRLRARENVPEERLLSLARERGEQVAELLRRAGVASERMRLLAPEKSRAEEEAATTSQHEVPLYLALEAAATK